MEDTEIKGRKLCVIFPKQKQNIEHTVRMLSIKKQNMQHAERMLSMKKKQKRPEPLKS
jgi:hypothetical protein